MSNSSRAATPAESQDPVGAVRLSNERATSIDRVVALFSGADTLLPAEADDWSASLLAVRGAAARVRDMQRSAREAVQDAQRAVREANGAARAAEERARHAEAAMREAIARAERAEEQARLAAERADQAEARTAEARAWLRRMHECMVSEFGTLDTEGAASASLMATNQA